MQLVHTPQHTQLSLFEAFMAQPLAPILKETVEAPWSAEPEVFSELSLRGAAGSCLSLLAPILRELSEEQDARWLTLIAPPAIHWWPPAPGWWLLALLCPLLDKFAECCFVFGRVRNCTDLFKPLP